MTEWLDCGNKNATVYTNQRYLEFIKDRDLIAKSAKINNSVIIPPVYIGEGVELNNTVLGPHASVGDKTRIDDSRIQNAIIQKESVIKNANIANAMVGNFAKVEGRPSDLSVGDYNEIIG